MDKTLKEKVNLKGLNLKRSVCGECNKRPLSGQPLVRCRECLIKFCLGHINGGFYCAGRTKESDELASVCDICRDKFGYVDYTDEVRDNR